ncbi:LysE family translocator [Halobacteriovorax sp. DA5]|uniref:LysE family translocator n=1 Tax=unclassified Halobacteriovorax TaxID=2639665 RepID=UPI001E6585A9|nr:LysE family translocator [Halobacteriovorax sp. DA5]
MENSFSAFLFLCFILTITPGSDTALVLKSSISGNRKNIMATILGICSGLFIHAVMSSLGLSAILQQSAELFHFVKMIGAAYLIYLGVRALYEAWFSGSKTNLFLVSKNERKQVSVSSEFRRGLLTNILNPKVAIFYLTFLPQFIDINSNPLVQSIGLSLVHIALNLIWLFLFGYFVTFFKAQFEKGRTKRVVETLSGSAFLFFGLALAKSKD